MVREPDATTQPTPQDDQLMSKHRILCFKPQLRLEWRGQDGQRETEQSDHSANLGESITSSTRIRFSVHTGSLTACNRTSIGAFSCSTKTKREGRVSPTHSAEGPIVQVQRSDMSNRIILPHIERIVRSHQESVWPEDIE
jgi:hypothetical protein